MPNGSSSLLHVSLLGPVEVRRGKDRLDVGTARQRCVLAALAWEPRRLVTVDALVDRVWGDEPPLTARQTLYSYLSRLRTVLADSAGRGPLARGSGGYMLQLADEQLDTARFTALIAAARAAAAGGDDRIAADRYAEALGLSRGEPLAGLSGHWAEQCVVGLTERYWTAVEESTVCRLRLGEYPSLVADLTGRVAEQPARETLVGQLMVALYRSGRRANALAVYEHTRRFLVDSYGVDPSPRLENLALAIARDSPDGVAASRAWPLVGATVQLAPLRRPSSGSSRVVPRQLPSSVPGFVGRQEQMAVLDSLLTEQITVTAIVGSAGVGKTELAISWGHRVADRFPDGQLYVDLRGFTPESVPLSPSQVLTRFLMALTGVAPSAVAEEELAGAFRTALAGQRMLIVLDNAAGAGQVLPLLPGVAGSFVLITSRRDLDALVVRSGMVRVPLGAMSTADSVRLLDQLVGRSRVKAEPVAAMRIAELCAQLPLALRIAGAYLARRPEDLLDAYATRLETGDRLMELAVVGDETGVAVAHSFDLSFTVMPNEARHLFRLSGIFPGPEIDAHTASHLIDRPVTDTARLLDYLTTVHLLEPTGPNNFRSHDLMRFYAARRCRAEESAAQREAALRRLYGWYLRMTDQVSRSDIPDAVPGPVEPVPAAEQGLATVHWLQRETPNLLAAIARGAEEGPADLTWRLAWALYPHLLMRLPIVDAIAAAEAGLHAARNAGHRSGEMLMHRMVSRLYLRVGDVDGALQHGAAALGAAVALGDAMAEVRVRHGLALVHTWRRRPAEAIAHLTAALERGADDPGGWRAGVFNVLGIAHQQLRQYDQAVDYHRRALAIARDLDNGMTTLIVLGNLAEAYGRRGQYHLAARHARDGLAVAEQADARNLQGDMLHILGAAAFRLTRYDQALAYFDSVRIIGEELNNHLLTGMALTSTAAVLLRTGSPDQAVDCVRRALTLADHRIDRTDTEVKAVLDRLLDRSDEDWFTTTP